MSAALQLLDAITSRRIDEAETIASGLRGQLEQLVPGDTESLALLDYIARWVDFDGSYLKDVERLIARAASFPKGQLTLTGDAHLELAMGLHEFHREWYVEAIDHLRYAMHLADRTGDPDLRPVSRYYLARSFWKRSLYDEALVYAQEAKRLDEALGRSKRVAVTEMVEAWLHFLAGAFGVADEVLSHAWSELEDTDDFVNHGNYFSFRGRLVRQTTAEYDHALDLFATAVEGYAKRDPRHRNVARCHTNMAWVCRVKAQRSPGQGAHLRTRAFGHLTLAESIYSEDRERHHRGLGRAHTIRALVFADAGEFQRARDEARRAYRYGAERGKEDYLIMADARVAESYIELKCRGTDDSAERASALASEAVQNAEKTGNRRLKVRAHMQRARTLLRAPLSDPEAARRAWETAAAMLKPDENDYLRDELRGLELEIEQRGRQGPNPTVVTLTRSDIFKRPLDDILGDVEYKIISFVLGRKKGNIEATRRELVVARYRVAEAKKRSAQPKPRAARTSVSAIDVSLAGQSGHLLNISATGALARTPAALMIGSEWPIMLQLRGGLARLRGRIARVAPIPPGAFTRRLKYDIGVTFTEVPAESRSAIADLCGEAFGRQE